MHNRGRSASFYERESSKPTLYNESEDKGVFVLDIKGNQTEFEKALEDELLEGEVRRVPLFSHGIAVHLITTRSHVCALSNSLSRLARRRW